jgi:hypothetical protein
MNRWLIVVILPLCFACGGKSIGFGTTTGAVNGSTLQIADVAAYTSQGKSGETLSTIVLTSTPSICEAWQAQSVPTTGTAIYLLLADGPLNASSATAAGPGQYRVDGPDGMQLGGTRVAAAYFLNGAVNQCPQIGRTDYIASTGGSLTIGVSTLASQGEINGSFDLFFGTANHVTGTFDAVACDSGRAVNASLCQSL